MPRHFISYSTADALEFVTRLRDELEAGLPSVPVWFDKRDIRPGQEWDDSVGAALKTCASLIFVMTRDSVEDDSVCKREWTYALSHRKPVIPLRLHPDAETPLRLANHHHVDFTRALDSDEEFNAALARLRKHLAWLVSPAGRLQTARARLAEVRRELRRAGDVARQAHLSDEIERLEKEIAKHEASTPARPALGGDVSKASGAVPSGEPSRRGRRGQALLLYVVPLLVIAVGVGLWWVWLQPAGEAQRDGSVTASQAAPEAMAAVTPQTQTSSPVPPASPGQQQQNQPAADALTNPMPGAPLTSTAEVFGRFLDPRQTDTVTLAHWQAAQSQTAYSLNSQDPLARARALFIEGQVAYLRGDYASALVSFNNAALVVPDSAFVYYGLGNAYLARNQTEQAERAYRQAVRVNPTWAMGYKGLGDALSKQGKKEEALAQYERARSLGYTSPAHELSAVRSLLGQRRWAEAIRELKEINETEPTADIFVVMGDCYVGMGQPLSASKAYLKATELDPKAALAFYKYGEVMFKLREYASAMEAMERAIALDATGGSFNHARAREVAGQAALKLGSQQ